ncbi:MAG: tRNA (adenosine(37)-N6)-threonylcarbamoyltransferase complex transferase subunit TsaD [Anaerolineae bacterium]
MTTILGVETSCDETAAAVVRDGRILLSNVVASQAELHKKYGGVFPEMASRQHMLTITPVIREALEGAEVTLEDLDALAVVHGPGLSGSLLVGLNTIKALGWARDIPLIGVNHLEAHVYANWLIPPQEAPETFTAPSFPLICLVVSGGHTALILMSRHHEYRLLGQTIDDAAGEAFDKVARLLGLGYPGGPIIERIARGGDADAFQLPRALSVGPFDFSFSGLKTAVLRLVQEMRRDKGLEVDAHERLADATVEEDEMELPLADIAASFQAAVVDALVEKTVAAVEQHDAAQVLLAGGVAANGYLRAEMARRLDIPMRCPPIVFCTDNAAMVAVAGYYRYLAGERAPLALDAMPGLFLA